MTILLAGDIGGTKTLLALYRAEGHGLEELVAERYSSSEWPDLAPMVGHFLHTCGAPYGMETGQRQPATACFAVAGPVQHGRARLTNLPWQLDQRALEGSTGIGRVELVNDFAVLIYGLPHLRSDQQATVRPGQRQPDSPLLVLGAGTGLGVAFGQPTPLGLIALASEAAHAEFAPRSPAEWQLKCWLQADLGLDRLSIERVVSGTGLGHVGRWLLQQHHPEGTHPLQQDGPSDLPAALAALAADGDALACEALDLWLGAYGSVCGDLALTGLSRGGIWLAGGTAGKLLEALRGPTFGQAFLAKGRLGAVLESVPITAITDPAIGQFSAACRARMLLGEGGVPR
jgi:glucokinase